MDLTPATGLARARRAPLMLAAVSVISVAAIACSSAGDRTPGPTATGSANNQNTAANQQKSLSETSPSNFSGIPVSLARDSGASMIAPVPYYNGQTSQVGIWVTGTGSKDVAADVAVVYLGVEAREGTVSAAREAAAQAMTGVLNSIKALGVSEDDIVTTSFNIYPQTVWDENGREPRITGYIVSNQVSVTVKNLDLLDEVIDTSASEAGDLIRVNSVSFTVANPAQHGAETRQLAAADARAKAELYAAAMGVNLGPLVFLTEIGSSAPMAAPAMEARDSAMAGAGFAPTPIESGDVSLSTTIQAAFAIVP